MAECHHAECHYAQFCGTPLRPINVSLKEKEENKTEELDHWKLIVRYEDVLRLPFSMSNISNIGISVKFIKTETNFFFSKNEIKKIN